MAFVVVYHANVLVPVRVRDLLLRIAESRIVRRGAIAIEPRAHKLPLKVVIVRELATPRVEMVERRVFPRWAERLARSARRLRKGRACRT